MRLNGEQENVHCTVPHQTAAFLSLYVLFNVQRLLVGGAIVPYILAYKSQNLRQNLAQKVGVTYRRVIKLKNCQLPKYAISDEVRHLKCHLDGSQNDAVDDDDDAADDEFGDDER